MQKETYLVFCLRWPSSFLLLLPSYLCFTTQRQLEGFKRLLNPFFSEIIVNGNRKWTVLQGIFCFYCFILWKGIISSSQITGASKRWVQGALLTSAQLERNQLSKLDANQGLFIGVELIIETKQDEVIKNEVELLL